MESIRSEVQVFRKPQDGMNVHAVNVPAMN